MAAKLLRTERKLALLELGLAYSKAGGFASRSLGSVIIIVTSVIVLFRKRGIRSRRGLRYVATGG